MSNPSAPQAENAPCKHPRRRSTNPLSFSAAGAGGSYLRAALLLSFEVNKAIGCHRGEPAVEGASTAKFFQERRPFLIAGDTVSPEIGQQVMGFGVGGATGEEDVEQG